MRRHLALFCLLVCRSILFAEGPAEDHCRIYRGDGSAASIGDMVAAARAADVVFVGEVHDDTTGHQIERQLLEQLVRPNLALGMEMFERDTQPVLDEYLAGLITEDSFRSAARAWNNYKTDYRPLVEFAHSHQIPVIASNAPQRYVNRVSRLGAGSLQALPAAALSWLAPLPYAPASPAYEKKFREDMEEDHAPRTSDKKGKESGAGTAPAAPKLDLTRALEAQSLWDATMAFSIADYLTRHPGASILHLNGGFHTARRLGIVEHLQRYRPGARVLVVTMIPAKRPFAFDEKTMKDQGDFVAVTDSSRGKPDKQ